MDQLFIFLQHILPQHLLSRLAGFIADSEWLWLKNAFTGWFVKRYEVDMSEALEENPENYSSFNTFFTRELKPGARPIISGDNTIACPADGAVSQLGAIEHGRIFQAKGQTYSLNELLGGDIAVSEQFEGGQFATIYLSPKDYHRVHMPLAGQLQKMIYIPGDLYSVNQTTVENVPRLFSRNERAVCIFSTAAGPMAVVLVGAMIVAGIETVWGGQVAPQQRKITTHDYVTPTQPITLEKGEEMGRFKLGSTAIVVFGAGVMQWQAALEAGSATRMGEQLGELV